MAGTPHANPLLDLPVAGSFAKAFDFRGRSGRSEYWLFVIFSWLVAVAASMVDGDADRRFVYLQTALFFLPMLALQVRRLHDIGRSGSLAFAPAILVGCAFLVESNLVAVLSVVAQVYLWVLSLRPGEDRDNVHGPCALHRQGA